MANSAIPHENLTHHTYQALIGNHIFGTICDKKGFHTTTDSPYTALWLIWQFSLIQPYQMKIDPPYISNTNRESHIWNNLGQKKCSYHYWFSTYRNLADLAILALISHFTGLKNCFPRNFKIICYGAHVCQISSFFHNLHDYYANRPH